jgi:hypothetical protein
MVFFWIRGTLIYYENYGLRNGQGIGLAFAQNYRITANLLAFIYIKLITYFRVYTFCADF